MTRINLLPWREKKREQEKRMFLIWISSAVITSALIVFLFNYGVGYFIDIQNSRNLRLKTEITALDKKIEEISQIKKLRQILIARMMIVKNLQSDRSLIVRVLDEIINIMPDGVFLNHLERVGNKITILGYAESNTNISKLMVNIENSSWIASPQLTEIKKNSEDNKTSVENAFKLSFLLKPHKLYGEP